LPRGLLIDSWPDNAIEQATQLGSVALIGNYTLWDAARVAQAHAAGLRALSYTVNDASVAAHLLRLGTDGVITDRVDLFAPDT
jgi:glycerophosphoryl diester phosphodiesterase